MNISIMSILRMRRDGNAFFSIYGSSIGYHVNTVTTYMCTSGVVKENNNTNTKKQSTLKPAGN